MNQLLILPASILILYLSGGSNSEPICDCFENRLKIKELLSLENGDLNEIINSEEYKKLKIKKAECQNKIEPEYFEKKNISRNGRSDRQFLLEELGDCDAVKKLLGEENIDNIK